MTEAEYIAAFKASAKKSMAAARAVGWYGNKNNPGVQAAVAARRDATMERLAPYVRAVFENRTFLCREYARMKGISSSKASEDLRWMRQHNVIRVVKRNKDNANLYQVVT